MNNTNLAYLIHITERLTGVNLSAYKDEVIEEVFEKIMALTGVTDAVELVGRLKKDEELQNKFLEHLTINYTTLFRGAGTWTFLQSWLSDHPALDLKVLIVGCSSGEEAISLKIVADSVGKSITIQAVDYDQKSIERAKSGVYPSVLKSSFVNGLQRFNLKASVDMFVSEQEGSLVVKEQLLKGITYECMDVLKDFPTGSYDLVLCRNMLIYFKSFYKTDILNKIHKVLVSNGVLVLGNLDGLLIPENDQHFQVLNATAKAYSKRN